jgi:hypothetical protein
VVLASSRRRFGVAARAVEHADGLSSAAAPSTRLGAVIGLDLHMDLSRSTPGELYLAVTEIRVNPVPAIGNLGYAAGVGEGCPERH